MKQIIFSTIVGAAIGVALVVAQAQNPPATQNPPGQTRPATADPYANNPNPARRNFRWPHRQARTAVRRRRLRRAQ